MKLNRKCMMMVMGAALVGLLLSGSGCKESDEESSVGTARAADSVALCVKCGQIKGSDLCCKPDQATCAGCGLVKDSPGCCKIPKNYNRKQIKSFMIYLASVGVVCFVFVFLVSVNMIGYSVKDKCRLAQ